MPPAEVDKLENKEAWAKKKYKAFSLPLLSLRCLCNIQEDKSSKQLNTQALGKRLGQRHHLENCWRRTRFKLRGLRGIIRTWCGPSGGGGSVKQRQLAAKSMRGAVSEVRGHHGVMSWEPKEKGIWRRRKWSPGLKAAGRSRQDKTRGSATEAVTLRAVLEERWGQKPKRSGLQGDWRGRKGAASMNHSFKKLFWEGSRNG